MLVLSILCGLLRRQTPRIPSLCFTHGARVRRKVVWCLGFLVNWSQQLAGHFHCAQCKASWRDSASWTYKVQRSDSGTQWLPTDRHWKRASTCFLPRWTTFWYTVECRLTPHAGTIFEYSHLLFRDALFGRVVLICMREEESTIKKDRLRGFLKRSVRLTELSNVLPVDLYHISLCSK